MAEKTVTYAKKTQPEQKNSSLCKQESRVNNSGSPADRILHLQRTAGNQAVQRLIKSGVLQAKLKIGQPNDMYEQEADRVAGQVMRMPDLKEQQQIEGEKEEQTLQPKELLGQVSETHEQDMSRIVHEVLRSPGQPLDTQTRAFMEPRFGHDFSNVRVHTDKKAAESARAVNAKAYTIGWDVVFGVGQYLPRTSEGKSLLAHELTHIVQQNQNIETASTMVLSPSRLEMGANRMALLTTYKQQVAVPKLTIQRRKRRSEIKKFPGMVIFANNLMDNIDVQIQSWTEEGVGDLRDGIQEAAGSFKNWYASRARRPKTAAFISNLVWAVGGALSAVFPPASAGAVIAGVIGGIGGVAGTILGEIDPNAEPDAQVLQLEQNMIQCSSIIDRTFDSFGTRLRTTNPDIWYSIGIDLTSKPPLLKRAKKTLYEQAGIPRPNRPYGEEILTKMIYTYTDWEKMWKLRQSTFLILPESVEYALFTEDVRQRLYEEAKAEARRRLGYPTPKK